MTIARTDAAGRPHVVTTKPQLPISDQELHARVQWGTVTSPHFQLSYDRSSFAEAQARLISETLEHAYSLVFHFTHESFTDRIHVHAIDQRATFLLGRAVRSHFSLAERAIYLVQTSSQDIYAELIAYVAHAMRITRYARHYGITPGWAALEDGFGVFLNQRLSITQDVFPFFGADPDIIANEIYSKSGIRIAELWSEPKRDVVTLDAQILIGAFLLSLGDAYGDDKIATLSKSEDEITSETFLSFFGLPLATLETTWANHLPTSLLSLTSDERDVMLAKWTRAIEPHRHIP